MQSDAINLFVRFDIDACSCLSRRPADAKKGLMILVNFLRWSSLSASRSDRFYWSFQGSTAPVEAQLSTQVTALRSDSVLRDYESVFEAEQGWNSLDSAHGGNVQTLNGPDQRPDL